MRLSRVGERREPTRVHSLSEMRKLGRTLVDQQMWCWGRDIVRPQGNALLQYGFRKRRPPAGSRTSSTYMLDLADRRCVKLWGFGLLWTDEDAGCLFLERRRFSSRLVPDPRTFEEVWRAERIPTTFRPRSKGDLVLARRLLGDALSWVAGYEEWAQRMLGADYRELCVAKWHKKSVPAPEMAYCWEQLARSLCMGEPVTNETSVNHSFGGHSFGGRNVADVQRPGPRRHQLTNGISLPRHSGDAGFAQDPKFPTPSGWRSR